MFIGWIEVEVLEEDWDDPVTTPATIAAPSTGGPFTYILRNRGAGESETDGAVSVHLWTEEANDPTSIASGIESYPLRPGDSVQIGLTPGDTIKMIPGEPGHVLVNYIRMP